MESEIRIQLGSVRRRKGILDLIGANLSDSGVEVEPPKLEAAVDAVLRDPNLGFILIARRDEDEDEVVLGVAYVSVVWALEPGGRACWLEELRVDPGHRGRGIGRELVRAAVRRARTMGCAGMDLEIGKDNDRAGNLYKREGFTSLSRTRWTKKLAR
jgi:ribosomal protein S18 acetylase RimI-like enzyme